MRLRSLGFQIIGLCAVPLIAIAQATWTPHDSTQAFEDARQRVASGKDPIPGPKPLALYPFSRDPKLIDRLIERIPSGGVTVNDALMHVGQDDMPFGGIGESGMGHYHGREGFLAFSKLRPVFRQSRWATASLLMPPYGRWTERILRVLTR